MTTAQNSAPKVKRVNRGKLFEQALEQQHKLYEQAGVAVLRHTDPPIREIFFKGKRVIVRLRNPFLDYAGTWRTHGGKAMFIEAKATVDYKLRVDGSQGHGVDERQMHSLRVWRAGGALAFLLWQSPAGILLADVAALDCVFQQLGRKYVQADELVDIEGVRVVTGTDYLRAAEQVYYAKGSLK